MAKFRVKEIIFPGCVETAVLGEYRIKKASGGFYNLFADKPGVGWEVGDLIDVEITDPLSLLIMRNSPKYEEV
jgi:hypothetical protein